MMVTDCAFADAIALMRPSFGPSREEVNQLNN